MVRISTSKTPLGWIAFAYDGLKLIANSIPLREESSAVEFLKKALLKRGISNCEKVSFSEPALSDLLENRHSMELSFDGLSSFCAKVLKIVMKVPRGRVVSYKTIGDLLKTKAYRAIGRALAMNPFPIVIPCHRVVKCNGLLGGYVGGRELKELLLRMEGVEIRDGKVTERYLLPSSELAYRFW